MNATLDRTVGAAPSAAVPPRSLVVLAGLPGAGKTTLLRRLESSEPALALDSDQLRERVRARVGLPYRSYRLLVHLVHRVRVLWYALTAPGLLVVHEPSTRPGTRAGLVLVGLLAGRPRHLLWLDSSAAEARAGQVERGRTVPAGAFARHVRRADALRRRFASGWTPAGWSGVTVLTRASTSAGLRLAVDP